MAETRRFSISAIIGAKVEGRGFNQANAAISKVGTVTQRINRRIGATAVAAGKALDRMTSRYIAFGGAIGAGAAVRYVSNLQMRFVRLGIQANVSADQIKTLKNEVFAISRLPGIRIDPSQLISAVETIVEKTGDLPFAIDNLKNMAAAIQATGAMGADIGALTAEFKKMGATTKDDVLKWLDILVNQGKAGAFTLQNLASQGERVVSAYAAMGYKGEDALRTMGAFIQMTRMGTPNAESAATAFENLLSTIIQRSKELEKAGKNPAVMKILGGKPFRIFDPEQAKLGNEVFLPLDKIIFDLLKITGGKATVLSDIFDRRALRAMSQFMIDMKSGKPDVNFKRFLDITSDGKALFTDAATASKTFDSAISGLYTGLKRFADVALTGPIQGIADALNSLDPKNLDRVFKVLTYGAAALVGRKLGIFKLLGGAGRLLFGRGRGIAGAAGGLAGAGAGLAGGAIPVFVTNMGPGGMLGGGGGAAGGVAGGTAATLGRTGIGRIIMALGGVTGLAAIAGIVAAAYVTKKRIDKTAKLLAQGEVAFGVPAGRGDVESRVRIVEEANRRPMTREEIIAGQRRLTQKPFGTVPYMMQKDYPFISGGTGPGQAWFDRQMAIAQEELNALREINAGIRALRIIEERKDQSFHPGQVYTETNRRAEEARRQVQLNIGRDVARKWNSGRSQ